MQNANRGNAQHEPAYMLDTEPLPFSYAMRVIHESETCTALYAMDAPTKITLRRVLLDANESSVVFGYAGACFEIVYIDDESIALLLHPGDYFLQLLGNVGSSAEDALVLKRIDIDGGGKLTITQLATILDGLPCNP
jgi:hypothetical protein